jgi:hypothetical protein
MTRVRTDKDRERDRRRHIAEREERKYDPPSDRGQKIVSIRPCRVHGPAPTRYANSGHCVACATGR